MESLFSYEFEYRGNKIKFFSYANGKVSVLGYGKDHISGRWIKPFRKEHGQYGIESTPNGYACERVSVLLPPFNSYKTMSDETIRDMYGHDITDQNIADFRKLLNDRNEDGYNYSPVYVYTDGQRTFFNRYLYELLDQIILSDNTRIEKHNSKECLDLLGNILHKGDYCIRVSNYTNLELSHIKSLNKSAAVFTTGGRSQYSNIISLSNFGIDGEDRSERCMLIAGIKNYALEPGSDIKNNKLHTGDTVLFIADAVITIGRIKKIGEQKNTIDSQGREYFKYSSDTLNLTALGLDVDTFLKRLQSEN